MNMFGLCRLLCRWKWVSIEITTLLLVYETAGAAVSHFHKIDSLIIAGKYCLEKKDPECARANLTYAYRLGMSKDSMMYFAAEIYICEMAADTALVFNRGLELRGKLKKEAILEQRARIYASIGLKKQADSILVCSRRSVISGLSVYAYGTRNTFAMKRFLFAPLDYTFSPENDIDDMGRIGISYKLTGVTGSRFERVFALLDFNSGVPVPTRYCFDEESDTLLRQLSLICAIPWLPKSVNGLAGYRVAIHGDGKLDHFDRELLYFYFKKRFIISASHEAKWVKGTGLDQSTENISCSYFLKNTRFTLQSEIGVSHHFDRAFKSKCAKIGYIDTIDFESNIEQRYSYYLDSCYSLRFNNRFLDEYWSGQPALKLLSIPEHDFSLFFRSYLQIPVRKWFKVNLTGEIRGVYNPVPVKWYTYEMKLNQVGEDYNFFGDDFLVFHAGDRKYYLHTDPTNRNFNRFNLSGIQITSHEKRRLECFLSMMLLIEKDLKYIGNVYAGGTCMKSFSTLKEPGPVATLDYCWELRAGWKKDISLIKR